MFIFLEVMNIVLAILIAILSFIYSLVTNNRDRGAVKLIAGINYLVVSFLLIRKLSLLCTESTIIILLFNLIMISNLIDSYAGLVKADINILQTLKFKIKKVILWTLVK